MPDIPKVDAKHSQAVYDGVRSSPRPQYLGALETDINLVRRHALTSSVPKNVGGMLKLARSLINDAWVKTETISMRNAITQVSNYFCFRGVTEVAIRTKGVTHGEQRSQ